MKKTKVLTFALALTITSLIACSKAKDAISTIIDDPTPTDGSQSASQLAGFGYTCTLLSGAGTTLNGKALVRYLDLNADRTYSYSSNIYAATACAFGQASGPGSSTIYTQVNVNGTFAVGGTNTTPSTSTKITFTPTSFAFSIYNPQTEAVALALANWANSCSGGSYTNYSTTASSSKAFDPSFCGNAGGTISLGAPPAVNAPQYNIGYRASSSNFQSGSLVNSYSPDAGSFVGSYSVTWQ